MVSSKDVSEMNEQNQGCQQQQQQQQDQQRFQSAAHQRLAASIQECSSANRVRRHLYLLWIMPLACVLAVFLAAYMDAMIALSDVSRYVFFACILCAPVLYVMRILYIFCVRQPSDEEKRRLLELAIGDTDRHLTSSIQLSQIDSELAQQAAQDFTQQLPHDDFRKGLQKQPYKRLYAMSALILLSTAVLHIAFPHLLSQVLPRVLSPWADCPPYSQTQLSIIDYPLTIQYEEKARIEIKVAGVQPEELMLRYVVSDANAYGEGHALHCFQIDENTWAAHIGPIAGQIKVWADCGYTRSQYRYIDIDPTPILRRISIRIEQPSYTQLPDKDIVAGTEKRVHIAAVRGAILHFECFANCKVSKLVLESKIGTQIAVPLINGIGNIEVPAIGKYAVYAVATCERNDQFPTGIARSQRYDIIQIDEIIDNPPDVHFDSPRQDAISTPTMKIPLLVSVDDDFGLQASYRIRALNNMRAPNIIADISGTEWQWQGELDIASLGVQVGDTITVGVYALDNKPGSGQLSDTVERKITIVSGEAYNEYVRSTLSLDALNQRYQPIIAEIKDLIKKAEESDSPEEREEIKKEVEALEQKIKDMQREDPLFAVEPELQEKMLSYLNDIKDALDSGDMSKLPNRKNLEQDKKELEKTKTLAKGNALMSHFQALTKEQRRLAEALKVLKSQEEKAKLNKRQQAQLQELAEQQKENEERLERWQEELAKVVQEMKEQGLPQAKSLEKIGNAVRGCQAGSLMAESSEKAAGKDLAQSSKKAETAAERLENLLEQSKECQGQCQGQSMAMCSSESLKQCLSQMQSSALSGMGLSMAGTGKAGKGSSGSSNLAQMGGMTPSMESSQLEMFGPENLQAMRAAAQGKKKNNNPDGLGDGSDPADNRGTRDSTAYEQAVRDSTAVMNVQLSPREEEMVKEYFNQLHEQKQKNKKNMIPNAIHNTIKKRGE